MGQAEKAFSFYQQSLEMRLKLYPASKYPDGHPDLANTLNNVSYVLHVHGALPISFFFCQQSLEMNRTLYPASKYPNGHPDLATSLANLGFVLQDMGQAEQAFSFY